VRAKKPTQPYRLRNGLGSRPWSGPGSEWGSIFFVLFMIFRGRYAHSPLFFINKYLSLKRGDQLSLFVETANIVTEGSF
jgi:hypothetical protein